MNNDSIVDEDNDKDKKTDSKNSIDNAENYIAKFIQCKQSFLYFCSKYIKIEMPGGDINLIPYEPQEKLINLINLEHYVLVLKSRQIGISTIIQAYCCWLVTFYDNVIVGIVSKDGKEATDFTRAIRGMLEKLPVWMRSNFDKKTEQSFILNNGSKVYSSPVNPNAPEKCLRGKAITFLVIDEAAFIKFIDEAWTSMVPALSTNQMHAKKNDIPYGTIVLSTPNKTVGVGKWFYERYTNASSGVDIFTDFVIHWKDIKQLSNNDNWYKTQCELFNNDPKKIEQELELKFLATSGTFFDESIISILQNIKISPIERLKIFNGEAWKFSNPMEGMYYIIGVDTAPEHGEDKSTINVLEYHSLEQVWEYQGKLPVNDFIKVIQVACASYPGILIIESNSYGNQVVEGIERSQFSSMVYKEKRGEKKIPLPGLAMTSKTRPLVIDALYTYISQYPNSIKSKRLILELIGLITKTSGRVEADSGCHDDLVFSIALCHYVHKWDPPLLIDSVKTSGLSQEVASIIGDNVSGIDSFSNSGIIKHVKNNLDDEFGFIDVLSLYNKQ